MRAILMVIPIDQPSPLLENFAPHLWNLGTPT
jgi:hypothetical protein